jgi:Na+-driven multidrug efflux pump
MMIGLRILLMLAAFAIISTFLAYIFTRKPQLLLLTLNLLKITLLFAGAVGLIYVLERVLLG